GLRVVALRPAPVGSAGRWPATATAKAKAAFRGIGGAVWVGVDLGRHAREMGWQDVATYHREQD
ncbi:hypothetical protein C7E18_22485, partial [Stenotrophomonas maltophilia]